MVLSECTPRAFILFVSSLKAMNTNIELDFDLERENLRNEAAKFFHDVDSSCSSGLFL